MEYDCTMLNSLKRLCVTPFHYCAFCMCKEKTMLSAVIIYVICNTNPEKYSKFSMQFQMWTKILFSDNSFMVVHLVLVDKKGY